MKLKELRQKLNLSQSEMAKKIGIPQPTWCNYETEKTNPSVEMLIRIATFFNVSIDELVGRPAIIDNMKLTSIDQSIIKKLLSMNQAQKELTEFYIDTLLKSTM